MGRAKGKGMAARGTKGRQKLRRRGEVADHESFSVPSPEAAHRVQQRR